MLRKHILIASIAAALCCLPPLASAEANPFLPAPPTPQPAATTSSTDTSALGGAQGVALPLPPGSMTPLLPPPPAAEAQPIGKVNGELIYKDGARYKFKTDKKKPVTGVNAETKPKPLRKIARPSKKTLNRKAPIATAAGVDAKLPPGMQRVLKVPPSEVPVKRAAPTPRQAAIPPMPGKPAVNANKVASPGNPQGAKPSAVPIKVITEKSNAKAQ